MVMGMKTKPTIVMIKGSSVHNGRIGELLGPTASGKRFRVRLADGTIVRTGQFSPVIAVMWG